MSKDIFCKRCVSFLSTNSRDELARNFQIATKIIAFRLLSYQLPKSNIRAWFIFVFGLAAWLHDKVWSKQCFSSLRCRMCLTSTHWNIRQINRWTNWRHDLVTWASSPSFTQSILPVLRFFLLLHSPHSVNWKSKVILCALTTITFCEKPTPPVDDW